MNDEGSFDRDPSGERLLTQGQVDALCLLGSYTRGHYVFQLAGDGNAPARVEIMSALLGRRVPKSKAGVTVLRESLMELWGGSGTCIADAEEQFSEWARNVCDWNA